jgi:hypothetical protein
MTDRHDDDLLDVFGPLRHTTTSEPEISAAIARGDHDRGVRRRRTRRIALAAVLPLAAAVGLAGALIPGGGDDGGDGSGSGSLAALLPARAEAAIAPRERILELTISTNGSRMREWSLAGADRAMQVRRLITDGPFDEPPTDEDSTSLTDRDGRIVDTRGWFSRGPGATGELQRYDPSGRDLGEASTIVGMLRQAYDHDLLDPAGTTRSGERRLRGTLTGSACERTTVVLDRDSFVPRSVEIVYRHDESRCPNEPPGDAREQITITHARTLPATARNRRLLEIGDWPVKASQHELPPPPPLDEG